MGLTNISRAHHSRSTITKTEVGVQASKSIVITMVVMVATTMATTMEVVTRTTMGAIKAITTMAATTTMGNFVPL